MADNVTTHQAEDDARNEGILIYVDEKLVLVTMRLRALSKHLIQKECA